MSDLNHFDFIGRLTADAKEVPYGEGKKRIELSVCNNQYENGENRPNYFNLAAFGKHAESLFPYFKKGQWVSVEASIHQDRWEKDGSKFSKLSIRVIDINLIGAKKSENGEIPSTDTAAEDFETVDFPEENENPFEAH